MSTLAPQAADLLSDAVVLATLQIVEHLTLVLDHLSEQGGVLEGEMPWWTERLERP